MKKLIIFLALICAVLTAFPQAERENYNESLNKFVLLPPTLVQSGLILENSDSLIDAGTAWNFTTQMIADSTYWRKVGNYVYLETEGDSLGLGIDVPLQKFHVVGNGFIDNDPSVGISTYSFGEHNFGISFNDGTDDAFYSFRLNLFELGKPDVWGINAIKSQMTLQAENSVFIGDIEGVMNETTIFIDSESDTITLNSGGTVVTSLSGSGERMVTASSTGVLSTQAIPSGSGTVTSVGFNDGTGFTISGSPITENGSFTFALDFSEFTDITESTGIKFVVTDPIEKEIEIGNVDLSDFNNDPGFATEAYIDAIFLKTYQVDSLRSGIDTLYLETHRNAEVLLTSNSTVFLSDLLEGYSGNIEVLQDGTGGWTFSVTNTQTTINGVSTYISTNIDAKTIVSWYYSNGVININFGIQE